MVPPPSSRGRLNSPEHFFKLPSLVCFILFVFSFLTCFLLVFLSFCSDSSSSSFLCVPFNSKSFLFWSPAAASVFSSASQRAAQTDAAFLSLFFISVLVFFKALTPQSAAAACQQTRLRPIPTAQRRPLNLKKKRGNGNVKSQRGKQTPPSLLSHFTCSSSQLKPPWAQVLQGKKIFCCPLRPIDRSSHSDWILFSPHPPYNLTHSSSSSLHLKVTNCYAKKIYGFSFYTFLSRSHSVTVCFFLFL